MKILALFCITLAIVVAAAHVAVFLSKLSK